MFVSPAPASWQGYRQVLAQSTRELTLPCRTYLTRTVHPDKNIGLPHKDHLLAERERPKIDSGHVHCRETRHHRRKEGLL